MKNYFNYVIYALVLTSVLACAAEASDKTTTDAGDTEGQTEVTTTNDNNDIEQIRKMYTEARKKHENNIYKEVKSDVPCFEEEQATLTRLYDGDNLEMMFFVTGTDHVTEYVEIYLKDGEPYFIFEKVSSWTFAITEDPEEQGEYIDEDFAELRTYIKDGKVIESLEKVYKIESQKDEELEVDKVPNKSMTDAIGKAYNRAEEVQYWIKGEGACE